MAFDIKDSRGFFIDKILDTEGGGAYERELNQGSTPNKTTFREIDSKLETLDISDPIGLSDGVQIKLTTRGTEVSKVVYDPRREAAVVKVNFEWNTPTASRNNGRFDQTVYEYNFWNDKTYNEILQQIGAEANIELKKLGLPKTSFSFAKVPFLEKIAGPIVFKNTPTPQAIDQLLALEGNSLWTLDPVTFAIKVIERKPGPAPADSTQGIVGINVTEQSLTGASVASDRPAMVLDKANRGFKVQHGSPVFYGRDKPDPAATTFGADEPLELFPDLIELQRVATAQKKKINELWGYTLHKDTKTGQTNWNTPKDGNGNLIPHLGVRLVQEGVLDASLIKRTFKRGKRIDPKLLTHPDIGVVVEAKVARPPAIYKARTLFNEADQVAYRKTINALISKANGRLISEISKDVGAKAQLILIESNAVAPQDVRTETDLVSKRIGILALFPAEWTQIDVLVDLELGEFIIPPGDNPAFAQLMSAFDLGGGGSTEVGFIPDPDNLLDFIDFVKVNFVESLKEAKFRAHVVTAERLDAVISPPGGAKPFGAIEQGDYEKHNVEFNVAKRKGFLEPNGKARDDIPAMTARAEALANSLKLPAMAKGAITIYPGDERLSIGQPANFGVIVKIKHTYVPFFKSQFWLEGTPDVDNPVAAEHRKKIQEYEHFTQVNSRQIVDKFIESSDGKSGSGGGAKKIVRPHSHSGPADGGSALGDISVIGLDVKETMADGGAAIQMQVGKRHASADFKFLGGIGKMVSGDLLLKVTEVGDSSVKAKIFDRPELPEIKRVLVVAGGKQIFDDVKKFVAPEEIYQAVFIETADQDIPPAVAILVEDNDLICDHARTDGGSPKFPNRSTRVFSGDLSVNGDLDDITKVQEVNETIAGAAVKTGRWMLYMSDRSPCRGIASAGQGASGGDKRNGFITDGKVWARLADVLTYAEISTGTTETRLNLKTGAWFKESIILGKAIRSGPIAFRGSDISDFKLITPTDRLFGVQSFLRDPATLEKLGVDACDADGAWVTEIPFEACEMDSLVREFAVTKSNDDSLALAMLANDTLLAAELILGDDTSQALTDALRGATNKELIRIVAEVNTALAALAASISACACCFPEFIPVTTAAIVIPSLDPTEIALETPTLATPCG